MFSRCCTTCRTSYTIEDPASEPNPNHHEGEIRSLQRSSLESQRKLQGNCTELADLKKELENLKRDLQKTRQENRNLRERVQNSQQFTANTQDERPPISEPTRDRDASHFLVSSRAQEDFEQLYKILRENEYLQHIPNDELRAVIPYFSLQSYERGAVIFVQGEAGDGLYILASGTCVAEKQGAVESTISEGQVIGEVGIFYESNRAVTLLAITPVTTWFLRRSAYHYGKGILRKRRIRELKMLVAGTALASLRPATFEKVADAATEEEFVRGSYIIRRGDVGRTFHIIKYGTVDITGFDGSAPAESGELLLECMPKGKYFGEKALQVSGAKQTFNAVAASDKVICLVLEKRDFDRLIGRIPVESNFDELAEQSSPVLHLDPFMNLKLSELRKEMYLGSGTFGEVYLVTSRRLGKMFALKQMRKDVIVERNEQRHIIREKEILQQCRSDFIVSLFRTFRDQKFVYLLLEVCLGRSLWSLLKSEQNFSDGRAKFYVGCLVEALDYLHMKEIVHRDIKLENLLLDERGYLKLTDFGFATIIKAGEKTWTFCGTPQYIAPEISRKEGHDVAVDFWSLGVLIFELLDGNCPFDAHSDEAIYQLSYAGIDAVSFPKSMNTSAIKLIKFLCEQNSNMRLGHFKNGVADVRNHQWFQGFDWSGLRNGNIQPEYVPNLELDRRDHSGSSGVWSQNESAEIELSGWDENF